MRTTNYPAVALMFFLPAISVELLTGDTPLATYLDPITFIILNLTYGATLVLIRETVIRWHKGFASVVLLAAGYGMLNEAIDTKGVFAPHFYAVVGTGLEGFGRSFGMNIPWALNISIFHAVFSIIVPFTIVSAIFRSADPWIGKKVYAVILILVLACSVFSFQVLSLGPDFYHYSEGPGPILLILALMTTLILLAWKLPAVAPPRWNLRLNPIMLFIFGYGMTVAFINAPSRVQAATHAPGIYIAFLLLGFVALPILLMVKLAQPTMYGKLALVTGLLMPIMVSGIHAGAGSFFATVTDATLLVVAFWRQRRQSLLATPSGSPS